MKKYLIYFSFFISLVSCSKDDGISSSIPSSLFVIDRPIIHEINTVEKRISTTDIYQELIDASIASSVSLFLDNSSNHISYISSQWSDEKVKVSIWLKDYQTDSETVNDLIEFNNEQTYEHYIVDGTASKTHAAIIVDSVSLIDSYKHRSIYVFDLTTNSSSRIDFEKRLFGGGIGRISEIQNDYLYYYDLQKLHKISLSSNQIENILELSNPALAVSDIGIHSFSSNGEYIRYSNDDFSILNQGEYPDLFVIDGQFINDGKLYKLKSKDQKLLLDYVTPDNDIIYSIPVFWDPNSQQITSNTNNFLSTLRDRLVKELDSETVLFEDYDVDLTTNTITLFCQRNLFDENQNFIKKQVGITHTNFNGDLLEYTDYDIEAIINKIIIK